MSYVRYTRTLVLDSGSARGHAEVSETVIKPGQVPTVEELHERMPGSRIVHGFQIIASNGRILAERKGLPDERAARRAVRDLRRALLPGVRADVGELAQAWASGHSAGVMNASDALAAADPLQQAKVRNPYLQELEEARRGN